MVNSIHSGSSALVAYGYEASYAGGATLSYLFGKEQKCNGLEFNNSQQALGQIYTPLITDFAYKKNYGGCSMEYVLSNPWIFGFIFNDAVFVDATPNTHTWYADPDAVGVTTSTRNISSAHLQIYQEGQTGNCDRNAKGVVCPTLNIKTGVDQLVQCTQQLIWGNEDAVDTTLGTTPPTETFKPYSFANGSVKLIVSGGTVGLIQDLDITFDTGAELVYEVGDEDAAGAYRKILNMTGKISMALVDKTNIDRVMARTELADMELKFTNGLTGDSRKAITMTFTGIGLSRHESSGIAPGELLIEHFDFQCRSVIIVAENDTVDQFA